MVNGIWVSAGEQAGTVAKHSNAKVAPQCPSPDGSRLTQLAPLGKLRELLHRQRYGEGSAFAGNGLQNEVAPVFLNHNLPRDR